MIHEPPRKDLATILAVSVAVAFLALYAIGRRWTDAGYRPSVVDTIDLWAYHRSDVYAARRDHVVLLGTSLMQFGFSLDAFHEAHPDRRITQLAIHAQYPMASLRDLARDPDFEGIAVVDVHESSIPRETWDQQQEFVDYYRERYPAYHELECPLVAALQERFVVLNHHYPLDNVLARLARGEPAPPPYFMTMRADRACLADYSDVPADLRYRVSENQRARTAKDALSPDEWLADAASIDEWVCDIHERGGRVVFVRFPADGPIAEADERVYPRSDYWGRLGERVSAALIDGRDVPGMCGYRLPDFLHLDHRDARPFTRALLAELARKGVLPPPRTSRR